MGIYISGVKGLPEQVQENKENIKDIQEEIEGIDFDAIHNLENQVAENTQDINTIENNIGLQSGAITDLQGRMTTAEGKITTLEDKTQEITRDSNNNITQVGEDLNVKGNISLGDTKSIILGNDGHNAIESSGNGNSYIDFDSQDNPEIASDGNIYKFTITGITLNGNPVGGGVITYINDKASGRNIFFSINGKVDTQTLFGLRYYLNSKGITSEGANPKFIPATGHYTNSGHFCNVIGISTYFNGLTAKVIDTTDNTELNINMTSASLTFLEV